MLKKYFSNVTLHRKCLIGYWIVFILAILMYLYSLMLMTGQGFQAILTGHAGAAIALFIAMMTGMNLLIFYRLEDSVLNDASKAVILYGLLLQQICTQNLLGAFFLFVYVRAAGYRRTIKRRAVSASAWFVTATLVLIALFSLFLLYRLSGMIG
ncbi:TPA: hypothetical protein ACGO1U_000045 [Streptococcus suis]